MYICMHACVYVCMCVCMYACVYVCVCMCISSLGRTHIHKHTFTHVPGLQWLNWKHIRCRCMYIHTFTNTHKHTCIPIHGLQLLSSLHERFHQENIRCSCERKARCSLTRVQYKYLDALTIIELSHSLLLKNLYMCRFWYMFTCVFMYVCIEREKDIESSTLAAVSSTCMCQAHVCVRICMYMFVCVYVCILPQWEFTCVFMYVYCRSEWERARYR
jgi:hypothetical protein